MKKLFVLLAIIGAVAAIANALRRDDLKNDIDRATSSMGGSTPAPAPVPSADGADESPAAEDAATGSGDSSN